MKGMIVMQKEEINGSTQLLCLLGDPVEHSLSPLLHNSALENLGLNYTYCAFKVRGEQLREAINGVRALGIKGANITIPHKQRVLPLLDHLSPDARKIGAVNTLLNRRGVLLGFNTDGDGFVESLKREANYQLQGKRVVLLGAGGAARAVAFSLLEECVSSLTLINRGEKRLELLLSDLKGETPSSELKGFTLKDFSPSLQLQESDILINATSVGMSSEEGQPPLVKRKDLHPGLMVVDLVYNPLQTNLLREAERAGARTFGGWGMLLYQAVMGFKKWTRFEPPVEVMKERLLHRLKAYEDGSGR